jgi:hypothetical protein
MQGDHSKNGQADGKTADIDHRKQLVPGEVAERVNEIIFKHNDQLKR